MTKRFVGVTLCLAVLAALGALAATAEGTCRAVVARPHYAAPAAVYHAPAYVAPAYAQQSYHVPYVVSFGDPDALLLARETIKLLSDQNKLLLDRALAPGQPQQPPPMPDADGPVRVPLKAAGLAAMLQANCANCHDKAVAGGKGKGHMVLTEGGAAAKLSAEQLGEVLERVASPDPAKAMPPGGRLPAAGRLALVSALVKGE